MVNNSTNISRKNNHLSLVNNSTNISRKNNHLSLVNNSTNISRKNNHLLPQIIEDKKNQNIWHWKYRSWLQTGTQLWQGLTSQWDYNPTPLDNWISNHNTDINKK
jgi:hypothetical protein